MNRTPLVLAISFPLLGRIRDLHPLETCAARRTEKRDRFRNPDIPSSLCTGQQYPSGNHLCRSGHIDRGCSPLRIHNLCLPETLSPDIIGVDTFFFFWPGYAFLFPSLYTLQQPGHIFSQHLHDLNAFPILQDLIRGLSMDHIPIPG